MALAALCCGCGNAELPTLDRGWSFSLDGGEQRMVDLPHDWAFEGGYSPDGAQGQQGGYTRGGMGVYRKTFSLSRRLLKGDAAAGRRFFLDFDAVYMNSTVTLNGIELGTRPYGYISFCYDATDALRPGRNVLEVKVDNTLEPSARWYHPCGIYGGVRLRAENALHFIKDGVFVQSQNQDGYSVVSFETSGEFGSVRASVSRDGKAVIPDIALAAEDCMAGMDSGPSVPETATAAGCFAFVIPSPELWSPESPVLYTLSLDLYDTAGRLCDSETIRFGLKDVRWDPAKGLFLNGGQYKIRGVCEHLEGGPVGGAWTPELLRWKLQLLKDMGCNSVRTAHNPQLPFFYDICDELGLLVMDEAFDGWRKKAPHDYGEQAFDDWWRTDLSAMIRRDRNHACVYIYSIGNETKGPMASDMVALCHLCDPTRAVTSGHSASQFMDVMGVNGHSEKQHFIRDYVPGTQAFIGTETPHTWQVRGFYRTQTWYRDGFPNKGQDPFVIPSLCSQEIFGYDWTSPQERSNVKQIFNSSYDNATVRLTARHNITVARDNDWYSGYYRWTGFDYLGEAEYVHGGWPFRAFQGGVIDMAGFPKDHYYLYQSEWNPSVDMVHILPSWTHPDMAPGTLIPVWTYTTGDEAELFLNGASLGRVRKGSAWDEIQCEWMVPWTPGTLEAVAYRHGAEIARSVVRTAGEPCDFSVTCEHLSGCDCGSCPGSGCACGTAAVSVPVSVSVLTFTQVDAEGTMCPYGDSRVWLSLPGGSSDLHSGSGGCRVLSFENGNPVDDETNAGALSRRCFFGLSRAFVSSNLPEGAVAGMICCDRSLKTSKRAYIAVHSLTFCASSSVSSDGCYTVRYTTDGSEPGRSSALYEGPFDVTPGMFIKAAVYKGRRCVLRMSEEISGGLYWGTPGEPAIAAQKLEFAEDGSLNWYQENDGGERDAAVRVSYTSPSACRAELFNNGVREAILELPATSSAPQSVSAMITLHSGANNLTLRILGSERPSISRIDVL